MQESTERRFLIFTACVLGIGMMVAAVLLLSRLLPSRSEFSQGELVARTWPDLASGQFSIGGDSARNVLVVFTDYQCRPCRDFESVIRELLGTDSHNLKVVIRQNPLRTIYPASEAAALSAICAGEQGAFGAYHALLFDRQDSLGFAPWARWAVEAGVPDTSAFNECRQAGATRAILVEDLMLVEAIQVKRSPAIILNGIPLGSMTTQARIKAAMAP